MGLAGEPATKRAKVSGVPEGCRGVHVMRAGCIEEVSTLRVDSSKSVYRARVATHTGVSGRDCIV